MLNGFLIFKLEKDSRLFVETLIPLTLKVYFIKGEYLRKIMSLNFFCEVM